MWMQITDYMLMYRCFYPSKPKRVEPVEASGDPAYQEPEGEREKGKRDFYQKTQKAKKISGKKLLDFWV